MLGLDPGHLHRGHRGGRQKKHGKPTVKKTAKSLLNGSSRSRRQLAGGDRAGLPAAAAIVVKAKRLPATARVAASVSGGTPASTSVSVTLTPQRAPAKKKAKKH